MDILDVKKDSRRESNPQPLRLSPPLSSAAYRGTVLMRPALRSAVGIVNLLAVIVTLQACGPVPAPKPPTLPARVYSFGIVACGVPVQLAEPCPSPIDQATIRVHQSPGPDGYGEPQWANADGFALFTSTLPDSDVWISRDGFADARIDIQPPTIDGKNISVSLTALYPQPEARAPLALESADHDGTACHADAVTSIPDGPDINFWRGDAWGTTPAGGLGAVAGGSDAAPQQALTWFLDRYTPSEQQAILDQYRRDGYTHFALSIPDSRDGNGQSVEQYVATSLRVKAEIPFVAHFLSSKDFDPWNATAATRMAAITPYVDALVHNLAADILVVGWELDLWNDPHLLQDFIDALASRYPSLPLYVHFSTYHTAWQFDGEPRAAFWARNVGKLTGLLYQANPTDPCGLMQAHFGDALSTASGLKGFKLVAWELVAQQQFFGRVSEDQANARGWEVLNTPGGVVGITGFGNGARRPDGSPLLLNYPR